MGFLEIIIIFFFLLFSVVIHECSHGLAAYYNGDDTAKLMGRITLNPLPHIDPVGTILFPLLLSLIYRAPVLFGWAKPVPVNPFNFRNYERGIFMVGISGPLSNIFLGVFFCLLYRILPFSVDVKIYFLYGGYINFVLAFFNLIPIPPLDGSRVLSAFLPVEIRERYNRIERFGIFIIMGLAFFGLLHWVFGISKIIADKIAGVYFRKIIF
ncbi:MAG TPA: site-2 protease family protein [Firmicutes bacterium]|nr:MAG: site-2 protease family protein [Candidatus Omnitrophota bacterium]HDD65032.1 site-2 protease family protein [Bacillota bacterium]